MSRIATNVSKYGLSSFGLDKQIIVNQFVTSGLVQHVCCSKDVPESDYYF
jgi:hypothetical protein